MADRPAFLFYAGDWKRNANLRRCSPAARGAWIDVLCLMHDSDEYGVLRWPLKDIANAAGISLRLLRELVDKSVLKGDDKNYPGYTFSPMHAGKKGQPVQLLAPTSGEPCWFSSRFVRDEYVRLKRSGASPDIPPKTPPKPPFGEEPKPPSGGDQSGHPSRAGPSVAVAVAVSEALTKSCSDGASCTSNSAKEHAPPLAIVRSIGDWNPKPEIIEALVSPVYGVPSKFVDEQIIEFRTYWRDDGKPATSWDAKFLSRCAGEWKRHGHTWLASPGPARDTRSAYEILKAGLDDMEQQA